MDKNELFKASGLGGTIDCALPQSFFDVVTKATGYNAGQLFVWWYPPRDHELWSISGRPLSIAELYSMAIRLVRTW